MRAAARSGHTKEARAWAGNDFDAKVELVQSLLDEKKYDEAARMMSDLNLVPAESGAVLAVQGRLDYLAGQAKEDKALTQRGLDAMVEAWRKQPGDPSFYRTYSPFPRESLIVMLTKAGRRDEARQVADAAVTHVPEEVSYYETTWKNYFAQPKADYSEERQRVRKEAEALLNSRAVSPDLLRTVAAGYEMAGAPDQAELVRQRLLHEFPYSRPSQDLRRIEALKTTDLAKKLALLDKYNSDFLTLTLYNESFKAVDDANAPDAELLRAAEAYIKNYPYTFLAVYDIGQVFVRRNIYLDHLAKWFVLAEKSSAADREDPKKLNAWDLRLLGIRGEMLLLQGNPAAAEKMIRPLLDAKAQGFGNIDNGRNKMYLGDVLLAQGRKPEALEMYAQAYAESQHYYSAAGDNFRKLYRELKGGEQGLDDYLSIREGMFQIAAGGGIERGTKINEPAPDFTLMSVKGERVSLASLRGKVVIINFWATWCHSCIDELPHFQEYYDSVKNDPGVALFAITTDENRGLVDPFLVKRHFTFPVLFDENIRTKFGVRGIPATFIIDPQGMTRLRMVGFNPNEPLVPYLARLVAEYRAKPGTSGAPAAEQAPAAPAVPAAPVAAAQPSAAQPATETPTTAAHKKKQQPLIPSTEIEWHTNLNKALKKYAKDPRPVIAYFTFDT